MVTPLPVPKSAAADARNRAVRTLVIGLLVDAGTAAALVLAAQLPDVHWTRAWWSGLGLLVAGTIAKSVASYIGRKVAPPSL